MANVQASRQSTLWFERLMAMIATINLGLVLFDLSYIPKRDFYLRQLPQLVQIYDKIKGIEPHRETENYLATVNTLKQTVNQASLSSPQVIVKLEELRNLSNEMIDGNPFAAVGKSGTLEKIKNRLRTHTRNKSAKKALATFWSQSYLEQQGWNQQINYFDKQIAPLIATNYYRRLGENGEFINNFWMIDIFFITLFGIELIGRSYWIKRHHPEFSWLNTVLWRWYDLFLLLPFWRLLRFLPVIIRLDQGKLLNLQPVRQQIHHGIVANFAEEITEIVVVRVINQIQSSIEQGDLISWLLQKEKRPYIDINNINEVEAISGIVVRTLVYQVLPKIQPEIVAILRHTIDNVLNQSPIYRNLLFLPMLSQMQTQLSEQIATQIATSLYDAVVSGVEDPVSAKLSRQLMQSAQEALGTALEKKYVVSEIQSLLLDFLEEVKINYVQRLSQEDIIQILQQTKQLRTRPSPVVEGAIIVPKRK